MRKISHSYDEKDTKIYIKKLEKHGEILNKLIMHCLGSDDLNDDKEGYKLGDAIFYLEDQYDGEYETIEDFAEEFYWESREFGHYKEFSNKKGNIADIDKFMHYLFHIECHFFYIEYNDKAYVFHNQ